MKYIIAITKIASLLDAHYERKCLICKTESRIVYCCSSCWDRYKIECNNLNINCFNLAIWAQKNKTYIKNKLDLMKYKLEQ